jgi:hypothetical protein
VCVLFYFLVLIICLDMSHMNDSLDGSSYVYPSSMSQDLMVSMILYASRVRPSSALAED